MNAFSISFNDTRFTDMNMTSYERVQLLHEMIQRGAFDLRDASVSNIWVVETGDKLLEKLVAMVQPR